MGFERGSILGKGAGGVRDSRDIGKSDEGRGASDRWGRSGGVSTRSPAGGNEKENLLCIGSSIVRGVDKTVRMNQEGSYLTSISGAGIIAVMEEAVAAAGSARKNTKLFIGGGGNSLAVIGGDETVRRVREGIEDIRRRNKSISVVFLGITPRPKMSLEWDDMRLDVNRRLKEVLGRMDKEGQRVMFLEVDSALSGEDGRYDRDLFKDDGIHPNEMGTRAIGLRMLSVVNRRPWDGSRSPPLPRRR